ncbi:MAG: minor capsid protein [Umezawaea sp.]
MTPAEEFAQLLQVLGLGTYAPTGTTGTIFLRKLPDKPDVALAVARYPGGESDARLGYDDIRFQVRVRGSSTDVRTGEALAQRVYDELHGLPSRYLPGGTWMVDCVGLQSGPIDIGDDPHHRPEWTVNFRSELKRPTVNRT